MLKAWFFSVTKSPYSGLPWLLWFYVLICNACFYHSGVFTGHLYGFDDHVRMTQVLDWINNDRGMLAGWYDRTLMRADPPEGFTTIWSRIVDVPIAIIILISQQFVPQKTAALIAATVIPLIEVAILFRSAAYFARPLLGRRKAQLINLFIVFSSVINPTYFSVSGFAVGEASHRSWYAILYLLMFGSTARIAAGSAASSPVYCLGASLAVLCAVGIEAYPMMASAAALLAVVSWYQSRPFVASRASSGFLLGAGLSFLLLPLHQPPASFFVASFVEPSILGPVLLVIAGLFLRMESLLVEMPQLRKVSTGSIMGVVVVAVGCLLVWSFPDLRHGSTAGLSQAERIMASRDHYEAKPVHIVARDFWSAVCLLMPSILACVVGEWAVLRTRGRKQAISICYFGFASFSFGMCELYSRFYHHAQTTACVWLVKLWERAKTITGGYRLFFIDKVLYFILLGPAWMLFFPAAALAPPLLPRILLFPAYIHSHAEQCDLIPFADYINAHYPKRTIILAPYWMSSAFLYYTNVTIDFLANYPSHDKFIDNYAFFRTHSSFDAREIALRHGVDLIAICKIPNFYQPQLPLEGQLFTGQLQGGYAADWLKPIKIDRPTDFMLFEVNKRTTEPSRLGASDMRTMDLKNGGGEK